MRMWMFLMCAGSALAAETDFVKQEPKAKVASKEVKEASGLAVSSRDPDFLWIVNDSGAGPEIHLAGTDGSDRGKVTIAGAKNVDWEDLAAFRHDGTSYLLIADCGDNASVRNDAVLYVVEEPALPKAGGTLSGEVKLAWTIHFGFEDGPRDCESVAVDEKAGKIILVSKRTKPPVVYELPLKPKTSERSVAKRLVETQVDPPKAVMKLPYIAQPTGMDISSDGMTAAVVSYYGVFLFPREAKESWPDAFAKQPVILAPHGMAQAESVAFSRDGRTLFLVSERGDDRIIVYQR